MPSARIECFVVTPTGRARRFFRRWNAESCPANPNGYHDARVFLAIVEATGTGGRSPNEVEAVDERWPSSCACGFAFGPRDRRQILELELYAGTRPTSEPVEAVLDDLPPGALWRSPWLEGVPGWCGADGQAWSLMLPCGPWHIDGPAKGGLSSGRGWVRTGEAPRFSATPSILYEPPEGRPTPPRFHAWLTEGMLEVCD